MAVNEIDKLIQLLGRVPGLGPRSARRAVLYLMKRRDQLMVPLAQAMQRDAGLEDLSQVCVSEGLD